MLQVTGFFVFIFYPSVDSAHGFSLESKSTESQLLGILGALPHLGLMATCIDDSEKVTLSCANVLFRV